MRFSKTKCEPEKEILIHIRNQCLKYSEYLTNNNKNQVNINKCMIIGILVSSFNSHLDDTNYRQQLNDFSKLFGECKMKLIKSPDSSTMRFLKIIGHLLTFGVVAKFKADTFQFFQSSGKRFCKTIKNDLLAYNNLSPITSPHGSN